MDTFIYILLFIIGFIFYVHIISHYKKGDDLEIYEMDYTNSTELEKTCSLRQPVVFSLHINATTGNKKTSFVDTQLEKMVSMDAMRFYNRKYVKVYDTNDYYNSISSNNSTKNISFVYLPFSSATVLMNTDPRSHFFIQNNDEFIEQSNLKDKIRELIDPLFKPYYSFIINTKYDIILGSKNVELPLRFHTVYRHFIIVAKGSIHVKMTPHKHTKYLNGKYDIENFDHYCPYNVWFDKPASPVDESHPSNTLLIETEEERKRIQEEVPFIEFDVSQGNVLFVPSYWWYSIRFSNEQDTILLTTTYHDGMNVLAHSPDWVRYYIHQQNNYLDYKKNSEKRVSFTEPVVSSSIENKDE